MAQKILAIGLLMGVFFGGTGAEATAATTGLTIHIGLQIPAVDSPALNAPTASSSGLGSIGNVFVDIFERFGIFGGIYPVDMGAIHLGLTADAMWHYDMDSNRTPFLVGYNHVGLTPALTFDLSDNLFVHGAFGLNRMGYRSGTSDTSQLGTLGEASAGLRLGTGGKGLTLEALFQNRTGIETVRYGLIRAGLLF